MIGLIDLLPTGSECLWKSTALLSESGHAFNQHNFQTVCCFRGRSIKPKPLRLTQPSRKHGGRRPGAAGIRLQEMKPEK